MCWLLMLLGVAAQQNVPPVQVAPANRAPEIT
jgi:hypothetical protein